MNSKYFKLIFLIIFIVAIYLRIRYLNTPLWYDEACSWYSAKQNSGIINNLINIDLQHTPIYFVLLKFWMKMFGQGEITLRILSLLFGIASIPLTYIVSKKLLKKDIPAIFTYGIMALSPLMMIFSVEVRMYPVVVFLVLLSLNYLIDFDQTKDKTSLIKLTVTNIFIPYTFVGGILYNFTLAIFYINYLCHRNKNDFKMYINAQIIEWLFLIPYFILISYYARIRSMFVIAHESLIQFSHIIDVIKNFFGVLIDSNIYWPSDGIYTLSFFFTILTVVPCFYFVYGIYQGYKKSSGFLKLLYRIFCTIFLLSIVISSLKVNVFTVRYFIYLLPPFIILGIWGLFSKLSPKHCNTFLTLLIISMCIFSYKNAPILTKNKEHSFKSVRLEADKLGLKSDDVVLMPFGSDAPYYFRNLTSPRVPNIDFHKTVRNPYNNQYYDKDIQKDMACKNKYDILYNAILKNEVFSQAFYKYFMENVNQTVPKKSFVLIALFAQDSNSIIDIQTLRKQVKDINDIKKNFLDIMFKKYMCDIIAMLNTDFDFLKMYNNENYTYLLFQKK